MSTRMLRAPAVRLVQLAVSLSCATVLLAGCGGGGGSEPPIESAADFPIANAVAAYAVAAHQYNLAGALDGVSFTMRYTYTPDVASTFEGHAAATAFESMVMQANGALVNQATSKVYFATNPYVEYGAVADDGTYSVFNQTATLPATARVGQSGPIGTGTDYANSTKAQILATGSVQWSLEPDTAMTALFCMNQAFTGSVSGTGSECYRIDTAGQVLGMIIKVDVNGKTLTLQ